MEDEYYFLKVMRWKDYCMIPAIFEGLCPSCGGDISSFRLFKGLPCSRCLPHIKEDPCSYSKGLLREFCIAKEKEEEFSSFSESLIGSPLWTLQKAWALRFFLGRSFSILAPTGLGKTTFGLLLSTFLSKKGKRAYIILPTRLLVEQTVERLKSYGAEGILFFSKESRKSIKEKKQALKKGEFKILVTTSMFLYKNFHDIPKGIYDLIFIDDVDSFLKTARNVDKVLLLLGVSPELVEKGLSIISKMSKAQGKKLMSLIEEGEKIRQEAMKLKKGNLIISSATSNPKSRRVMLFRLLLGFEVGKPIIYLRNIVDSYTENFSLDSLLKFIDLFKDGILLFTSPDKGKEHAYQIYKYLKEKGYRVGFYEREEDFKDYKEGKINIMVGIASYKNPLARGVDLPERNKYALFFEVPKLRFRLSLDNPTHLYWALLSSRRVLVNVLSDEEMDEVEKLLDALKPPKTPPREVLERALSILKRKDVLRAIENADDISLNKGKEGYEIITADVTGYLQASGRVSRLYGGGITKGLSLVFVDDNKSFKSLMKKALFYSSNFSFSNIEELNLSEIMDEIEEDRKKVRDFLLGEKKGTLSLFKPTLIVVESPNKAKTIAKFFGRPLRRKIGGVDVLEVASDDRILLITSSLGHVLDLTLNEIGLHGVLVEDSSVTPFYQVLEGKEGIISGLRDASMEVEEILIATDPDTEGEKIAWDLYNVLRPFNKNIKRMEFHEVTYYAIREALKNLRGVEENLVKAQILRRIADRWVGFEFSSILQKEFGKKTLSAGRVQTPVLGWIIDRWKEHRQRVSKVFFSLGEKRFSFLLPEKKRKGKKKVAIRVKVSREEVVEKHPLPPYTTDEMLKDASTFLRFSATKTMSLAQELFEMGFITYHRTDSTRVSPMGMSVAKEYIKERIGEEYVKNRPYAQGGAHECIRPTRPLDEDELKEYSATYDVPLSRDHLRLYSLIFKRFMASQMREAIVKEVSYVLEMPELKVREELTLPKEVIRDGFNVLWPLETVSLPEGEIVSEVEIRNVPKVPLYTQGELVAEMKSRGIGRPSTYAIIIQKILERKYAIEVKGKLIPTKLGLLVYKYLSSLEEMSYFVKEEFTKELEGLMNNVEEGKEDYVKVLNKILTEIKKKKE